MIRPKRYVTETCCRCSRSGWVHENRYSLMTEEEQIQCFGSDREDVLPRNLPKETERCYVSCGSDIYEAVREAKELAAQLGKKVSFEFNGKVVVVTSKSNTKRIVTKWWKDVYGKTPEESMRDR